MITKINHYFQKGPEIILLPHLEWDYADKPDFNADGFFIDYDIVTSAHPPLRDRMFYGLNKIASFVIKGVTTHSV